MPNQTTPLPISATPTPPRGISTIQDRFRPSPATIAPLAPSPRIITRALCYLGFDLIGFSFCLLFLSSIIALPPFYRYVDEPLALKALEKHGAFTHYLYGTSFRKLCYFSACGARMLIVLCHYSSHSSISKYARPFPATSRIFTDRI